MIKTEPVKVERLSVIVKRLGWRFHAGLVMFVIVVITISVNTSIDYYESASPAAAAVGVIILRFWAVFSRKAWFWATVIGLAAFQVPLVIASKDLANTYRLAFMFPFSLVDIVLMDYLILRISPDEVEIVS